MKMTLLDYVQSIMSSLNSDNVNSISDNDEAMQVAEIVKTTYFNVVARAGLPEHDQLIQLEPSNDVTMPVLMYIPDGIGRLEWLKYFNSNNLNTSLTNPGFQHSLNVDVTPGANSFTTPVPGYEYVTILPNQQFLDMVNSFNPENDNIATFTFNDTSNSIPGNFTFYYRDDRQPAFCTVLSDYYVIFDAYDSAVDSTLQSSKTMALGRVIPSWRMEDDFIPFMDEQQVPLLLNEAKSLAFFELKQTLHTKAEQESKRQWSSLQKDKSKVNKPGYFDALPNFGRNSRSSYAGLSYFKLRGWDRV